MSNTTVVVEDTNEVIAVPAQDVVTVVQTAQGPQGPAGAQGPTGTTGLVWRGAWVSTNSYSVNDAVTFSGSSYRATSNISVGGTNPTVDTTHWTLFAQAGSAGSAGAAGPAGVNWTGTWASGSTYAVNDGVTYNGGSFRSKTLQVSSTTAPNADPTNWELLAAAGLATIQKEGTPVTYRSTVNFKGDGIAAVDNSGSSRTDISFKLLPVFNVKNYGAVGDGTTDDYLAVMAAITAAAGFGIIYFPEGTYYLNYSSTGYTIAGGVSQGPRGLFVPNTATGIHFKGAGKYKTTIKLSKYQNMAFVVDRQGAQLPRDYLVYQNIAFSDFTVDANHSGIIAGLTSRGDWVTGTNYSVNDYAKYNGALYRAKNAMTPSSTNPSSDTTNWEIIETGRNIIFGTYYKNGWSTYGQRLNFKNIEFRRLRTINVPTDPTLLNQNISIGSVALENNETQLTITDILCEDCEFFGGNYGFVFGGVLSNTSGTSTLSASNSAGDTVLTVVSATGFTAGQNVIVGNGTVLESKTISSVNTGANTITLTAGLTLAKASGMDITSALQCNVWHDRIRINRCYHDTLADTSGGTYPSCANIQIATVAFGGRVDITDFYGANSGDVGIETDCMLEANHTRCTIVNANSSSYLAKNFNIPHKQDEFVTALAYPLTSARQRYIYRDCVAKRDNAVSQPGSGTSGWNLNFFQTPAPMFGTVIIENCKWVSDQTKFAAAGAAILCNSNNPIKNIEVRGFQIVADKLNYANSGTNNPGFIYLFPQAVSPKISLKDIHITMRGTLTVGSGTNTPKLVQVGANGLSGATSSPLLFLNIDGIEFDYFMTSPSGITTLVSIGEANGLTPSLTGSIRRVRQLQWSGDTTPKMFVIADSTKWNSFNQLNFNSCSQFSGTGINFNTNSNLVKFVNAGPDNLFTGVGANFLNVAKVAAYTLVTADRGKVVLADATSGAFNVTLPSANGNAGDTYTVKRINSGANAVTLLPVSATVDGASSIVLNNQYDAVTVMSDGANWVIV